MLINFIRRRVKETISPIDSSFVGMLKVEIDSKMYLNDDMNMRPVLPEDPLLFSLRDALVRCGRIVETDDDIGETSVAASTASAKALDSSGQLEEMQQTLSKYQSLVAALTAETSEAIDKRDDAYYFDGYSHVSIHETMLRDAPRTTSYAEALMANRDYVRGKVVLDVGCGTGILCMLAARAGARKVIGVDMSSMIERARRVVERNGFADVITLVRGRLEDLDLPVEKGEVDIVVSEWMGYGLYFENMLSSVLHARDQYLSPDGVLMPSDAVVSIEGMQAVGADDRINWWKDVYGFDMSDIADLLTVEAQVQFVEAEEVCTTQCQAHRLNMREAEDSDLDFTVGFKIVSTLSYSDIICFGFGLVWLVCEFLYQYSVCVIMNNSIYT
jgi:protein arginine N-methyltransferase 1